MHNAQALSPADIEELGAVFTLINRHPGWLGLKNNQVTWL